MKKKVIIVEPKINYRHVLKNFLLKTDKAVIDFETSKEEEFLGHIRNHPVDIVFMCLSSSYIKSIKVTKLALEINPNLTIIGMALFYDNVMFEEFIYAGGKDYLLKTCINTEVINQLLEKPDSRKSFARIKKLASL